MKKLGFNKKHLKEFVEGHFPKRLEEYSWSHDDEDLMIVRWDHQCEIYRYFSKSEQKKTDTYGLKHAYTDWENMSDYKSRPEWCELGEDQRLYLFNFNKDYDLNQLKEYLTKCQKEKVEFEFPEERVTMLEDIFWCDDEGYFDRLTSPEK